MSVAPGPGGTDISVNWPKVIHPVRLAKSARLVAAWYDDGPQILNGFSIVSDTRSQDWDFGLEARSADRAHQVYVNVPKRSNDTFIS